MISDDRIRQGFERRLSAVESLLPPTPRWRTRDEPVTAGRIRVVGGSAVPRPHARRLLAAGVAALAGLVVGTIWLAGLAPSPGPAAEPSFSQVIRPAIEPRLEVRLRDDTWTLLEDLPDRLELVPSSRDAAVVDQRVGVYAPQGVYDPAPETRRLPLPAALIEWMVAHPDLGADPPQALTVGGEPVRSIDATVTYVAGPRGETAQFIDIGPGPLNLEPGHRLRLVLLELAGRPLLIIYDARTAETFDRGLPAFEQLLADMEVQADATP